MTKLTTETLTFSDYHLPSFKESLLSKTFMGKWCQRTENNADITAIAVCKSG